MFKAIITAHEENKKIVQFIDSIVEKEGKEKHSYEQHIMPQEIISAVKSAISAEAMEKAVFHEQKQLRDAELNELKDRALGELSMQFADLEQSELSAIINEIVYKYEKETVRKMILKDAKRPDGRALDQVRKLSSEVDILPRTHGSAIFARGQTQVLTITTLGSISDYQRLDGLDTGEERKRYMHHYNFPSYSVGETRPSRGPGRREIGHGALAERALLPVLPSEDDFPYAIRLVSEVLSSNGSTSQASVCGSSLSLMAAGVPIKAAVAGISVGLVTEPDSDNFVLLTDIQGVEDFFGDMDFKVAGTVNGITAIQMDIKIDGLTPEIIKQSLEQCCKSRLDIIKNAMNPAIETHREELSPYAPKIGMIMIDPSKIGEIIGPRGKIIIRITEESGVDRIDTEDDGRIFVSSKDANSIKAAIAMIEAIVKDPVVGEVYNGKVTRIMSFGAFVEIAPEKEGMVHVSQLAAERVANVEDAVSVGQELKVKLMEIDDQGRLNFSHKATLPGYVPEVPKPRSDRPRSSDRGSDRRGGDRQRGGSDRNSERNSERSFDRSRPPRRNE